MTFELVMTQPAQIINPIKSEINMGFYKLCVNPSDSYSAEQLEFYSAEFATKGVGSTG